METLVYSRMNSPVGPLLLGMSGSALVVLAFGQVLPERVAGRPVTWQVAPEATEPIRRELEEYFASKRRKFKMQLDLRGTDFQKSCWEELLRIPFGETRSYAEIARAVGRPNAYRAVGQANHFNPVAIVVPCHRVLAAGTRLGGYGGGLATKAFLLRLEGAEFQDDGSADHRQSALNLS
jgi:methylated-DNA-[protein]-cysteine S-methyltransferase